MSQSQSSNRRIAKNTLMLYIRMLISMLVGLYTSRVVLQTLGVEDYGIFGVVGGVVSMMGFLNASMSGATSRFITFELGKGDMQRVRDTFSSAMIIHIGIALVVILLAETVGLWFLCNKLVIPEGRMEAAHWVYQCSIISAAVGITQSPYTAVIMSREKMDIYAYMELLNVSLKLGIVYLLVIGNFDKLILYSILTLVVSFLIAMLYRIYCIRKYKESHFQWVWNKKLFQSMLAFMGWNTMSECGYSFRVYGSNLVLNMFFGPIVNAAGGIAATVQSILIGFVGNITTALRPPIIKAYSENNIGRMCYLVSVSIRINLFLVAFVIAPFFTETHYLLSLWLGQIPGYSVIFCRYLLLSIFISCVSQIITIGIQAVGKIRKTSVVRSLFYTLTPFVIYFVFKLGVDSPSVCYLIIILVQTFVCFVDIFIFKSQIKLFSAVSILSKFIVSIIVLLGICSLYNKFCSCYEESFLRFFLGTLLQWISLFFFSFLVLFKQSERETLLFYTKKVFNRLLDHD